MTTRNRTQLKSFFVKNAIPTEGNFADVIDSTLNQSEDGIFKSPNDSLALVAAGDSKRVLRLFGAPPPAAADWQLSLNPPQSASTPQSSRVGLGVSDGAGALRLFLDATTGNLGVGTNAPAAPLDVRVPGVPNSDRLLVDATTTWDGTNKHVTLASANAGQLNLHNPHVPWLASESRASIRFGRSGGVSGGNFWDVGTRASNTFSISLGGASDPKFTILANGNVGIGTPNPAMRLEISGNANIAGTLSVASLINGGAFATTSVNASAGIASASLTTTAATVGNLTVTSSISVGVLTAATNIISPNLNAASISSSSIAASNQISTAGLTASALVNARAGLAVTGGPLTAPQASIGTPPRKALFFNDQLTSYPVLPSTSVVFSGGFTIQAWIYLYAFNHFARIIDLGNGASADNIMFFIGTDGRLGANVFVVNSAPLGDIFSDPGVLTLRRWTHVAMSVATDGTIKLYRDGVEVRSARTQVPRNVVRGSNYLGRSNWANDPLLHGHLADVSIWQGARTPTTGPLVGNEPGLLALWHLSQDLQDSATTPVIGHGTYANGDLAPIFGTAHESSQETAVHAQAWIPLQPYNPGWAPYGQGWGPPSYFKDSHGIVRLSGLVSFTNANSNVSGPPFNMLLPPGYRPQFNTLCSTACSSASGFGRVDVFPNGQIHVTNGHGTWTSLDGIAFRAFA